MARLLEAIVWYNKEIFRHPVEVITPVREGQVSTTFMVANDRFSLHCSTPADVRSAFETFRMAAYKEQIGIVSFAVGFDGGMPSHGLVKKIKEELVKASGIGGETSSLRFGYLPIQGKNRILGCVAYLQNIQNYA